MRQLLLVLSVLLLGLSWAVAQSTTSQTSPSSTSSGQATSGQTAHSGNGNEMKVEGCLSGSNGSYTLTANNGKTYQLSGDTAKLSDHVGHEVKITGTMGSEAGTPSSGGAMGNTGAQTLDVTSVKHVSKTCKSAGGGSSKY